MVASKAKEEKATNIEADVVFDGELEFEGVLVVKGKLRGSVKGDSLTVLIEKDGELKGTLKASKVDNYGKLEGKAQIDEYNLFNEAESSAELSVKSIMIEKGAEFNGSCKMEK